MLRPLPLDILALLFPLGVGALTFLVGRSLRRWPVVVQVLVVGCAILVVAGGVASLVNVLPEGISQIVSWLGGGTVVLCWAALLLFGVAWSAPNRRLSSAFLVSLAGLCGCLLAIEGSGPLSWRYGAAELWQNFPDSRGCLRQSSGLTCSPTAAAMLLHRYNIRASEGEMAYLAGTSLFGSDALQMSRALNCKLRPHGLRAETRRATYDECIGRSEPFLAHVHGQYLGHAILVERVFPDMVEVVDPVDGQPGRLTRETFEELWGGTLVEIVRDSD